RGARPAWAGGAGGGGAGGGGAARARGPGGGGGGRRGGGAPPPRRSCSGWLGGIEHLELVGALAAEQVSAVLPEPGQARLRAGPVGLARSAARDSGRTASSQGSPTASDRGSSGAVLAAPDHREQ